MHHVGDSNTNAQICREQFTKIKSRFKQKQQRKTTKNTQQNKIKKHNKHLSSKGSNVGALNNNDDDNMELIDMSWDNPNNQTHIHYPDLVGMFNKHLMNI